MNAIIKTALLSTCVCPTLLHAETSDATKSTERPNIIFILADDMGIGDLGCYGQKDIQTPNIDELAKRGMRFTHHYSGSTVSAPSRCCLMTGKHTGHGYVRGNKGVKNEKGEVWDIHLPAEETTVAQVLKDKGYATLCVGKWGLGGPNTTGSPVNKGYDYFFGYLSQRNAHSYYPEYLFENEERVMLHGKTYSHWLIMDKALKYINKIPKDQPFFAYFAVTPPHADLDYPDISQYEGKFKEKPYINKKGRGYKTQESPRACYASMVSEVDKNVGQVLEMLKKRGQLDNTLVIFSSDNGVHNVGGYDGTFFNSNGPFRGHKRDLYEGGVRTPFVASWPAVIKAGTETDHISTFWDFLPTVCDIADAEVPAGVDGISYLPTLKQKDSKQKKHKSIYYEFFEQGGKQAIIKDGWKLVRLNLSKKPELLKEQLFYLPDDIAEKNDLAAKHPEKVKELRQAAKKERTKSNEFKFKKDKKAGKKKADKNKKKK